VNFTYVPDSCFHSQPLAIAQASPALYSTGVPPSLNKNWPLIFSMWMRPSCTASVALAISRSLRAPFSGSANGSVVGELHA
jgi:hypothetical protein